ncbi:MAG: DNA (cytosine-5-)-methyltransferase [Flavobacteriaceae bacterium]|jgi:DNA (cytosine-5)-methyltransferase 1|nr:DNA (cytosine-5-)-methyltransferase [Flavobacteriaceae bacterium]
MTHGSLFSGIGGFEIAAEQAGFKNVFSCEIDAFCRQVLKYHFPKNEIYEDIKKTDFKKYRGAISVVSGGFPCQPFSVAGKRKGTGDNRYLWDEMFRCIREIQPKWVIAENVPGLLTIEQGMVFEQACADLETENYEVQTFIIPACAIDAPHRRSRVWIIAHSEKNGRRKRRTESNLDESNTPEKRSSVYGNLERLGEKQITADTASERLQRNMPRYAEMFAKPFSNFPTQSPVRGRDDGISAGLVGITFPKWRRKSLEALGNAIVPQIAYQIFKTIKNIEI